MLTGVHILLTYRCTNECDHCFVHSSPWAGGTFTLDGIREVLEQAKAVGTVGTIYFEGGEPFLFHPLLLAGARAARAAGFEVGIVTNSYWAESEADAELWLAPLAEVGIADLSVSDDVLHHGETEDSPAARARRAAERLGIPCGSICIPRPGEGEGVRFRGRAADRLTEGVPTADRAGFTECPDEDLEDPGRVHVDALGNVHLCQGLLIGNLLDTPLGELLSRWDPRRHPICGALLEGGPAALAAAFAFGPDERHVSACHLCYRIRERLLDRHPGHLGPPQVYGRAE